MRRVVLSLMVGLLAAVAFFVLTPILIFLLLRIFDPALFEDDTLTWVSVLAGLALLGLLICVSLLVGVVAVGAAHSRLADRGWLSTQALIILFAFAATVAAAGGAARLYYWEPPEIGPQQTGLPSLHLARTLTAKNLRVTLGNWLGAPMVSDLRRGWNPHVEPRRKISKAISPPTF
jgi:hypothetical protein